MTKLSSAIIEILSRERERFLKNIENNNENPHGGIGKLRTVLDTKTLHSVKLN